MSRWNGSGFLSSDRELRQCTFDVVSRPIAESPSPSTRDHQGNKIVVSSNILGTITSTLGDAPLPYPIILEVTVAGGKGATHCSILEFASDCIGQAFLSPASFESLGVAPGTRLCLRLRQLPRARRIVLQPQSPDFATYVKNPNATLSHAFSSFACLTENDCVQLAVGAKTFALTVAHALPVLARPSTARSSNGSSSSSSSSSSRTGGAHDDDDDDRIPIFTSPAVTVVSASRRVPLPASAEKNDPRFSSQAASDASDAAEAKRNPTSNSSGSNSGSSSGSSGSRSTSLSAVCLVDSDVEVEFLSVDGASSAAPEPTVASANAAEHITLPEAGAAYFRFKPSADAAGVVVSVTVGAGDVDVYVSGRHALPSMTHCEWWRWPTMVAPVRYSATTAAAATGGAGTGAGAGRPPGSLGYRPPVAPASSSSSASPSASNGNGDNMPTVVYPYTDSFAIPRSDPQFPPTGWVYVTVAAAAGPAPPGGHKATVVLRGASRDDSEYVAAIDILKAQRAPSSSAAAASKAGGPIDLAAAAKAAKESGCELCTHCHTPVPLPAMSMHKIQCARLNWRCPHPDCGAVVEARVKADHAHCPTCALVFPPRAMAKHVAMMHTPVACECGESLPARTLVLHQDTSCPLRLAHCSSCDAALPARDLPAHEGACRAKTRGCRVCGARLTGLEMPAHMATEHGVLTNGGPDLHGSGGGWQDPAPWAGVGGAAGLSAGAGVGESGIDDLLSDPRYVEFLSSAVNPTDLAANRATNGLASPPASAGAGARTGASVPFAAARELAGSMAGLHITSPPSNPSATTSAAAAAAGAGGAAGDGEASDGWDDPAAGEGDSCPYCGVNLAGVDPMDHMDVCMAANDDDF